MGSAPRRHKRLVWQELNLARAESIPFRHSFEDETDSITSTIIMAITATINVEASSSTLTIIGNNPDSPGGQFGEIGGDTMVGLSSSSTSMMYLTSLVTGLPTVPAKSLDQFNTMSMISEPPASVSPEQLSPTSSMESSAAVSPVSSSVSGSALTVTTSPTSTRTLQPAIPEASPVTTVPHPTSDNEPQQFTPKDITTPIVAGVVSTVAALLLVVLLLWCRRSKKTQQKQKDLEREALSTTAQSPLTNEHAHSSHTRVERIGNSANISVKQSPCDRICESPGKLTHPRIRPTALNLCTTNRVTDEDDIRRDPFLTPTDQKAFSPNLHGSSKGCSESQIGLAVTTSHSGNTSDGSSTRSIDTVLHHVPTELADPFQDPESATSTKTLSQQESPITSPTTGLMTDSTIQHAIGQNKQSGSQQPTLSKSPTPPEELARRWIEVLKLEAAQAQQAAEDAARRARELKMEFERKGKADAENVKIDSGGGSDSDDDDDKTITA